MSQSTFALGFLLIFFNSVAVAVPPCIGDHGNSIPIDNAAAIEAESNTPVGFLMRAHVSGTIGQIYNNTPGHDRFELILGPQPLDRIEIVYNSGFGNLPELRTGMSSEACGDFINSSAQNGRYPPSPNRAIIHYVHRSTNHHLSGFVTVEGKVYGQSRPSRRPASVFENDVSAEHVEFSEEMFAH